MIPDPILVSPPLPPYIGIVMVLLALFMLKAIFECWCVPATQSPVLDTDTTPNMLFWNTSEKSKRHVPGYPAPTQ